ncbi:MAG: efflux RND transporter permease subunit [Pseudomonadota bacterium]
MAEPSGTNQLVGGLPGLSVGRPFLALVLNLLIILAGLSALRAVEVRELPDADRPVVTVRANYPGAAPETVDAEVTSVVEAAVARVNGVVALRSSSEENNFRIRVEFRPSVDLVDAANDVREAIARVERALPEGVGDIFVIKAEDDARPIMHLAAWSTSLPIERLTRMVEDEIVPELTAIEGVADVNLFGGRERVLRVELSPERLAAFGLGIDEVAAVLQAAQFDAPVGSFAVDDLEVLVRADATVVEPEEIAALMLRPTIRLGDVADVYFAPATPDSITRLNGRKMLNLGIIRQAKSNTIAISEAVRRTVDRVQARFPEIEFVVTGDSSVFIKGAIREVLVSLGLALVIVSAVVWMFLGRLTASMVPVAVIPVALIGALAGIWLLGFSVNIVTLLALVLATGLVVDDAIVVLESIQRRRAEGWGARAAAVIGTRQVFFAVIATTAVLVAVFVPVSFQPDQMGRLFREFGFVLAATVAISSLVALTLCPMLASRIRSLGGGAEVGRLPRAIGGAYAAILRPITAAPLVAVTAAGLLAGSAALVFGELGRELVPPEDRGALTVRMQGPDGVGLDHTDRQVERVEDLFQPWMDAGVVASVNSITGWWDPNRGRVEAVFTPWDERSVSQATVEADIRPGLSAIPGARARIGGGNSLGLWGGGTGGLQVALTGPQYPAIAEAAEAFALRLEERFPEFGTPRVEYQATQPQLSIVIDRARASDLGIPIAALSSTLAALVDQDEVTELTIHDEATPILMQPKQGSVRAPSDLLNLYVRARSGALVPLSQLVSFQEEGVAAELDRHGQRRAIEINLNLPVDMALADAVAAIQTLANATLPDGIGLILLGQAATYQEASSGVATTYLIAVVVIFLVLLAQFESITSAVIVMLTVPFGICAALFALWMTGTTINIYSQIGVLTLIGVMAKNGILLVEFADQLRDRGATVLEAVREAARVRLRPIAMTMASTVLAGLPLVLSTGPGAEARAAIGWVVFGGLGLASAFTLFLTPAAYALIAPLSGPRADGTRRLVRELEAPTDIRA